MAAANTVLRHASWLALFALWPFILWRGLSRVEDCSPGRVLDPRNTAYQQPKVSGPSPAPPTEAGMDGPGGSRTGLRALVVLAPIFLISGFLYLTLPDRMRSVSSVVAYVVALTSMLGVIFSLISVLVPRGFAPGWQVRCPKCGRTVEAAKAGIVRVGAVGRPRKLGYCSACEKLRWLIVEPISDIQRDPGEGGH